VAPRVVPTPLDADNPAGSCTLAACTDWRSGVRRFHVGTGHHEPTSDAGYTTAGFTPTATTIDQPLSLQGESIYDGLARIFHTEAQDEVGGIITSHVESVVETDRRGDSADAKLY